MLPSPDDIATAHAFLARRLGLPGALDDRGVRAALALAATLVVVPADEPAAVFFALARFPKALGAAARALPILFAVNLTRAQGTRLDVREHELAALYLPIRTKTMPFDQVRAWFAARTTPRS